MDVRVDGGPQDGTILVTWIPVTLNTAITTTKQVPVTGYAVFADGKRVTDVDSPTSNLRTFSIFEIVFKKCVCEREICSDWY